MRPVHNIRPSHGPFPRAAALQELLQRGSPVGHSSCHKTCSCLGSSLRATAHVGTLVRCGLFTAEVQERKEKRREWGKIQTKKEKKEGKREMDWNRRKKRQENKEKGEEKRGRKQKTEKGEGK